MMRAPGDTSVDAKRLIARRWDPIIPQVNRWSIIFWFVLTLLSATVVAVGVILLGREAAQMPPFAYSHKVYLANDRTLCPGDLLSYDVMTTVNRVPTVLLVVTTVWRVTPPGTKLKELPVEHINWFDIVTVISQVNFPIPDLPPADYELRVSAEDAQDGTIEYYRSPFTVPGNC